MKKKPLRLLFIGNSHTYYNSMPRYVAMRAEEEKFDCEVTMLAHPKWFLKQHVEEPEARFNIRYGHYDYVVLQEHSHPFGPLEDFYEAVRTLDKWISDAGSKTVIYMTWAKKDEEQNQELMTEAHRKIAQETGAILAPVGSEWWSYKKAWPNIEMYAKDGAHASKRGSDFAAKMIWEAIRTDIEKQIR